MKFLGTFMICSRRKFRINTFSGLLITAIK